MDAWLWISIVSVSWLLHYGSATPSSECPKDARGSIFIADDRNRCVYYWCLNGEFLLGTRAFRCAVGSGVPESFNSPSTPCRLFIKQCVVHKGMATTSPLPTSSTSALPTTRLEYSTSPATTPEDELGPGSGEVPEDLLPVRPRKPEGKETPDGDDSLIEPSPRQGQTLVAYNRFYIPGGIRVTGINTIVDCLYACVYIMAHVCHGVDFDVHTQTCWLHMQDTECGKLRQRDSSIHVRTTIC